MFSYQVTNDLTKITVPGLLELLNQIRSAYKSDLEYYHACIKDGTVVFDAFQELYKPGTIVQSITSVGVPAAFRVVQGWFQEHKTLFGNNQN